MRNNNLSTEEIIEKIKTICIICLSIILLIFFIAGISSISQGGKFGFFTLRFFIMSYDSAEVDASSGDLVVANKTRIKNLKTDENVVYKHNNRMIINKIEKIDNSDSNDIKVYVKNSENNTENGLTTELVKIENKDVMGKVLFKIRGMGNIALFIKSPIGALNLLLIFVCIFIISKKIAEKDKD